MHEDELLINKNNYKHKTYCNISTIYYLIYFIYNIILLSMVSFNTYYTIELYNGIVTNTDGIKNEINTIYDIIKKFINNTV